MDQFILFLRTLWIKTLVEEVIGGVLWPMSIRWQALAPLSHHGLRTPSHHSQYLAISTWVIVIPSLVSL